MLSSALVPAILLYSDVNIEGIELCEKKNEGEEKGKEKEKGLEYKIIQDLNAVTFIKESLSVLEIEHMLHTWNSFIPNINTPPPEYS